MSTPTSPLAQAAEEALDRGFSSAEGPFGNAGGDILTPFRSGQSAARTWLNLLSGFLLAVAVLLVVLVLMFMGNPIVVTTLAAALGFDVLAAVNLVRKNAKDLHYFDLVATVLEDMPPEHQKDLLIALRNESA